MANKNIKKHIALILLAISILSTYPSFGSKNNSKKVAKIFGGYRKKFYLCTRNRETTEANKKD